MPEDPKPLGKSAEFFKEKLKLKPAQLTLEYMESQNLKISSAEQLEEIEKNIRKAEFPVLVLGDNIAAGVPLQILEELQVKIAELGFLCGLGTHIHELSKGRFEADVEKAILESPTNKLIILISGQNFGTIGESKAIRLKEEVNSKTLFFFDHAEDYEKLVQLAKDKKFPVEFKYPIPYHGAVELKSKVLFGVLHCFYRYYRYKRKNSELGIENNNNANGAVI